MAHVVMLLIVDHALDLICNSRYCTIRSGGRAVRHCCLGVFQDCGMHV